MIEFTNISIVGFGSVQELNLSLNTKGITVIRGANGFGKTTIFTALVWALYGKNLKGNPDVNTWAKVRPKDYKGTKVEVYFKSENHIYCVIRCLKYTDEVQGSKGGNRLIYLVDGETISEKGKRSIQDTIDRSLGMSYTLFINSVMFGQGLKRLIQESGTNQREIFEEVFELGYLTKAKKIAQDRYAQSDQQYQSLVREIESVTQSITAFKESLKVTREKMGQFDQEVADKKKKLNGNLKSLKASIQENQDKLDKLNPDKLEAQIQTVEKAIASERGKLEAARAATGISLEDLINNVVELLQAKKYDASLKTLLTLQNAFRTQEKSKEKIQELKEKSSALNEKEWKIRELRRTIKNLEADLESVKESIKELGESAPDFQAIIDDLKSKIKRAKAKVAGYNASKSSYEESRNLYHWAYTDPLGNMGIKSYLFESSLGQLNEILETYSEIIGFSIQFQVDLTTARKDFKTLITFEGQQVSYDDLSGGQKQLTNLAMAFSMNTLIAQAQGTNIAFLDEVFESLSEDNIEIVISLIRKIYQDKTLFLITHQESLPIPNARVLRVKFSKGISQYEW